MRARSAGIWLAGFLVVSGGRADAGRPRIYTSEARRAELTAKIENVAWASETYQVIRDAVDAYVDRHVTDPEWIVSRLQMHWRTRYAETYVNGSHWSHGEGEAPVPTVGFAGQRDWNTVYADGVNFLAQRNARNAADGLMISLAGTRGGHMQANGMAMELYGKGMVLAPDFGRGPSYWTTSHGEFYARFAAHNTVSVDGISDYNMVKSDVVFRVLAAEPGPGQHESLSDRISFTDCAFVEPRTEAEQRRLLSIVRTSDTTGYYVDNFRSRHNDGNDKEASELKQIFVGRIFILIYGIIWILFTLLFKDIKTLKLFDLILPAAASVGLPTALPLTYGMFIKRTPEWAGWSTMVAGFIMSIGLVLGWIGRRT